MFVIICFLSFLEPVENRHRSMIYWMTVIFARTVLHMRKYSIHQPSDISVCYIIHIIYVISIRLKYVFGQLQNSISLRAFHVIAIFYLEKKKRHLSHRLAHLNGQWMMFHQCNTCRPIPRYRRRVNKTETKIQNPPHMNREIQHRKSTIWKRFKFLTWIPNPVR